MRDYVTAIYLKIQTACCLLHTSNLSLFHSPPLPLSHSSLSSSTSAIANEQKSYYVNGNYNGKG